MSDYAWSFKCKACGTSLGELTVPGSWKPWKAQSAREAATATWRCYACKALAVEATPITGTKPAGIASYGFYCASCRLPFDSDVGATCGCERIIRVDPDVLAMLLARKHELEAARQRTVSYSDAVRSLLAERGLMEPLESEHER